MLCARLEIREIARVVYKLKLLNYSGAASEFAISFPISVSCKAQVNVINVAKRLTESCNGSIYFIRDKLCLGKFGLEGVLVNASPL